VANLKFEAQRILKEKYECLKCNKIIAKINVFGLSNHLMLYEAVQHEFISHKFGVINSFYSANETKSKNSFIYDTLAQVFSLTC
jgi:hypothetical protein